MHTFQSIRTWYDEETMQHKFGMVPAPQDIVTRQVAEALASDTENKVRQALIDLGWTPPKGESHEN